MTTLRIWLWNHSAIRDQGLLTISFLAVLPNPADNLTGFYEPIREAIIQAFEEDALTPMKRGGHAAAKDLIKGPASMVEVLDSDDFLLLTGSPGRSWAVNPPPQSQREKRFLDSLDIPDWGVKSNWSVYKLYS